MPFIARHCRRDDLVLQNSHEKQVRPHGELPLNVLVWIIPRPQQTAALPQRDHGGFVVWLEGAELYGESRSAFGRWRTGTLARRSLMCQSNKRPGKSAPSIGSSTAAIWCGVAFVRSRNTAAHPAGTAPRSAATAARRRLPQNKIRTRTSNRTVTGTMDRAV